MRIGISITKSTAFRGVQQPFSNVYHYDLGTAVTAPADDLINELVAYEKTIHGTGVLFKEGKCWSAGGSVSQNHMLVQKPLTGTGTPAAATKDPERAILIRWPAGFDSRGRPVYLRKWYHSLTASFGGQSIYDSAQETQQSPYTTGARATMANKAQEAQGVGATEFWDLCSPSGRMTTGPAEAHPWLEHHQLGDEWRA